jgi:hypothetical protein
VKTYALQRRQLAVYGRVCRSGHLSVDDVGTDAVRRDVHGPQERKVLTEMAHPPREHFDGSHTVHGVVAFEVGNQVVEGDPLFVRSDQPAAADLPEPLLEKLAC